MGQHIHFLGGFLEFMRELNYVRELSPEFETERAAQAHHLLKETAAQLDAQPDVNRASDPLFPRVAMADLEDVETLADSMEETTKEIKVDFVNAIGRFAMGNDELALIDLEKLADKYLTACRLTTALIVHRNEKVREARKRQEADARAAAAYNTMDEKAGFPNAAYGKVGAVSAYPQELATFTCPNCSNKTARSLTKMAGGTYCNECIEA